MGKSSVDALLLIDVQNNLVEGPSAIPDAVGLLQRLSQLVQSARTAGVPTIHLQNDGAPGASDEPGSFGWEIHPSVRPTESETVIRKLHDDGFHGTLLDDVLRAAGVRRIAVAGLLSEMCVSATARGAIARGYDVVLVHDAHATYDLGDIDHRLVSRIAEHSLGDQAVITVASDVIFEGQGPGQI